MESAERTQDAAPHKNRKTLIAIIAAAVVALVATGGTAMGVASAETARLCAVARDEGASATKDAKASIEKADEALEAATSTTLPGDAGTSTSYADRPAVAAVEASDGVEAVAAVDGVEARASGAEHIADVTTARTALVKIKIPTECTDLDQAVAITAKATAARAATKTLDASVTALTADFALFQTDEAARIAAQIEAARVAAAKAKAASVAKAKAAHIAAERAAAEAAAYSSGSDSGHSGGGGYSSGGGSTGSGRPSGGGQVGPGGGNHGVRSLVTRASAPSNLL